MSNGINPRLIAQAPAMLAALKTVLAGFPYNPGTSDLYDEQPIRIDMTLGDWRKIRSIIAAAEGKQ